jgi:hypothetical protein
MKGLLGELIREDLKDLFSQVSQQGRGLGQETEKNINNNFNGLRFIFFFCCLGLGLLGRLWCMENLLVAALQFSKNIVALLEISELLKNQMQEQELESTELRVELVSSRLGNLNNQ